MLLPRCGKMRFKRKRRRAPAAADWPQRMDVAARINLYVEFSARPGRPPDSARAHQRSWHTSLQNGRWPAKWPSCMHLAALPRRALSALRETAPVWQEQQSTADVISGSLTRFSRGALWLSNARARPRSWRSFRRARPTHLRPLSEAGCACPGQADKWRGRVLCSLLPAAGASDPLIFSALVSVCRPGR